MTILSVTREGEHTSICLRHSRRDNRSAVPDRHISSPLLSRRRRTIAILPEPIFRPKQLDRQSLDDGEREKTNEHRWAWDISADALADAVVLRSSFDDVPVRRIFLFVLSETFRLVTKERGIAHLRSVYQNSFECTGRKKLFQRLDAQMKISRGIFPIRWNFQFSPRDALQHSFLVQIRR